MTNGRKLVDVLDEIPDLADTDRILMAMCPGVTFGFVPEHFDAFKERLNCKTCRAILEELSKLQPLLAELSEKVFKYSTPIKARNARRVRIFTLMLKIPGILWFFSPPALEDEESYLNESWYKALRLRMATHERKIEDLQSQDPAHWGTEELEQIGKSFTSAYFARGGYVVC